MKNQFLVRDFEQRLDSSIIRYKDVPVYVRVRGDEMLDLYHLRDIMPGNAPFKRVNGYDPDIDVSSCPLGYVNYGGHVFYIRRRPIRRFVQGITERSIEITQLSHNNKAARVGANTILFSQEFEDSVLGKFPSVHSVIRELRAIGGGGQKAISQKAALTIDDLGIIKVYFKTDMVGWIAPNENQVNVPSSDLASLVSRELSFFDWKVV